MPEFGDEFIMESYKVPWLIWIQLIVTILLIIILLFGFSIFTSDPPSSSTAASPSTGGAATPPTHLNKPSSSHRRTKVGDQRISRNEETSGELIREEDPNGQESSLKDSVFFRIFRYLNHPCNYFGLAKRAFLKCFGLDSSSENSRSHRHEKQE
ncbi:hypothetical protein DH2020_047826 [Rehmannia glutinosa]|uniref:Uncharacterized protein n=1 Tax=Rehmannia glutinosa TaxID=99300 RepID=A0ABR0U7X7_REHGL